VNHLLQDVAAYYSAKLRQHGATPRGVDWNSEDDQLLRFSQLLRVVQNGIDFSINDLGCGYGRLFDHMTASGHRDFRYQGYDLAPEMIQTARQHHPGIPASSFLAITHPGDMAVADYTVASGIFNVRLHHSESEWQSYVLQTLELMDARSMAGFSFNTLTRYSDKDRMRDDLYYADPCYLFDYCKRHFARNVALLHDYGLYEFTLLIRKS
jgi:SAM-dependent methyltransferase